MDYEQCLYSEEEKKLMGLMGEGQKELKAGLSKTFFSSRLIMNSRQLWNWHQRHKFLRAKVSSDILKFRVLEIAFSGVFKSGFQEVFSTADTILFCWNTRTAGNNAIKLSQVFHDTAWFKHFTDLNLFKYAFNVIQNWEMDALEFYLMVLIFC